MDIPESMRAELGAWNGGAGIDLAGWLSASGNYSLAVAYLEWLWPEFVQFEGYLLRKGFSLSSLRGFEQAPGATRESVERVMNHVHLADLHPMNETGLSHDKLQLLGRALKEIHEAKLAWQFPGKRVAVELQASESNGSPVDYELSFWQVRSADPLTGRFLLREPRIVHHDASVEYYFVERCHVIEHWNTSDDEQASIAHIRVEPGVTTRWHRLRGVAERYLILEGRGRMEVGDLEPRMVGPGDVVAIPAYVPQRIINTETTDLIFLTVCTPRFTPEIYEDVDPEPS